MIEVAHKPHSTQHSRPTQMPTPRKPTLKPTEPKPKRGYVRQVGCELEEKVKFSSKLDEVMPNILTREKVFFCADLIRHGAGNSGDEDVLGRFGIQMQKDRWW
ncbi:hypothetical protein GOODEAATRI_029480 [Goodea atripinnis]|uniref:Uncharacterized protein n=1 Tax=Goodea atripinnis TaxID=208336 RepID=A0ABV0P8V0_9TELE